MPKKKFISKISLMHYFRLIIRSIAFLILLYYYIFYKICDGIDIYTAITSHRTTFIVLSIIYFLFIIEMILRFFPSKFESPGCQKQFARNYIKTGKTDIDIQDNHGVMLVALLWIGMNCIFGTCHMFGWFDDGIMILLCGFYAVCDMICILFFCPFQSWFLKNKCCCTCRIYNWDYAMMFTPLFFVGRWYFWLLVVFSFILMIKWEIIFYKNPERFSEKTNGYLGCANCKEKLCYHKSQLKRLWVKVSKSAQDKINKLKN